jgi:hypothetical protein
MLRDRNKLRTVACPKPGPDEHAALRLRDIFPGYRAHAHGRERAEAAISAPVLAGVPLSLFLLPVVLPAWRARRLRDRLCRHGARFVEPLFHTTKSKYTNT